MENARASQETKIIPVILSGGMGKRLWPMSRESYPKQFLKLSSSEHSLIQETLMRVSDATRFEQPLIVSNTKHRFLVAEQMQQCGILRAPIILEPEARNTAPALAVAAEYIKQHYGNALMLVLPSDHIIKDCAAFLKGVDDAAEAARQGHLVTFGITPEYAETGYGYIRHNGLIAGTAAARHIEEFVEKPNEETAETYVKSGDYAWNSGMFMFPVELLLSEMEAHQPDIKKYCQKTVENSVHDHDFIWLDATSFLKSPAISIDYAIMERTRKAAVLPLECGWSDAGSWDSLWRISDKDENGNALTGSSHSVDTENCYISCEDGPKVSTLGVKDLVIISTKDTVLVADKAHAQDIKKLVQEVEKVDAELINNHRLVYRPWGFYDSIDNGTRHQVKRICVKPGAKLSLQMHYHRAEHWVVVSGTAKVVCDDKEAILSENESIYIPVGATHRIENPGKIPLDIIEVQSGSYLGEDDIVRFEDQYGRNKPKVKTAA